MKEASKVDIKNQTPVDIRPWSESDFPLLERLLGDPAMTEHIGGPESPDKIRERHRGYCDCHTNNEPQFVILIGPERAAAGWIGYWGREWQGKSVLETGWLVLPEFQGKGIATNATRLIVEVARTRGKTRFMHAYPSVDNIPSNIICQKAGFKLQGAVSFEYPKDHLMQCNDWCLDLFDNSASTSP
jgi:RimJ/RimL family protein N-acetyltransferase